MLQLRSITSWLFVLSVAVVTLNGEEVATCKQLEQILAEIRQLKEMIGVQHGQPHNRSLSSLSIDVDNATVLGSKEAPLTVVMFTDYECTFCRQFYQETFADLKKLYIEPGKVRFYSLEFPLESHKNALVAAQAGRCAAEQGKFWEMHDRMQSNSDKLQLEDLIVHADELQVGSFRQCMESGKYKANVRQGLLDAQQKGIPGTPSFVVGRSTVTGVEGELIVGAVPFGIFERKLGSWREDAANRQVGELSGTK